MKQIKLTLLCASIFVLSPAYAVDLLMDFQKATTYDPTYQTALAELQSNKASANQSYTAYAPTANYSTQRIQTDTSTRTTWTVTQPLINYEALSTFRMAQPRTGFAEATFLTKQQDLATRLLKAANAIILANENIKLNDSKIKSLDQQYVAAKRKLELGQGTITDQRDIEVKFAQSKSAQVGYKSQLETAAKQYAAITGERPNVSEFVLPEKHFPTPLKPALDYVDLAFQNSPSILAARYSERVAELDVQRATGSLLPTFSTSYTASKSAGVENKYSGVVLSLPLGASTFFARQGVQANYLKSKETRRDTEEKARVDVEKLVAQIGTSFESINIQLDAIKAAELSVEANVKSYEGGVRSAVDVLNATQTVFQVKSEYVTAVTSQAENLLALMNLTTTIPDDALRASYKYLFTK